MAGGVRLLRRPWSPATNCALPAGRTGIEQTGTVWFERSHFQPTTSQHLLNSSSEPIPVDTGRRRAHAIAGIKTLPFPRHVV